MRPAYGLCAGGLLATLLMAVPVRADGKLAEQATLNKMLGEKYIVRK